MSLAAALRNHARLRGVQIQFPLMDLQDNLLVSPSNVWGRLTQSLEEASRRYQADINLVGRFRTTKPQGITQLEGDWQFWQDERAEVVQLRRANTDEAAQQGIDALVGALVERYAVLPRGLVRQNVIVKGVSSIAHYAALLAYLDSLEFLDQVIVSAVQDGELVLQLDTHAQIEQLRMLLTSQARLVDDQFSRLPGISLLWQG